MFFLIYFCEFFTYLKTDVKKNSRNLVNFSLLISFRPLVSKVSTTGRNKWSHRIFKKFVTTKQKYMCPKKVNDH